MAVAHRSFAFVSLVVLALALAGCERGCLSTWLADHGAGAGDPSNPRSGGPVSGGGGPRGSPDLGGTDCSDGLARCSAGRVETSIAGHIPAQCNAPKERPGACACGWQAAGACAAGCVKDGLEVVAAADVARAQLCVASVPVLRLPTAAEAAAVTVCAEDGVSCVDGLVKTCVGRGQPAKIAGACVSGCATGLSLDPGDVLTHDGVAAILCRHEHAERR